MHCVNLVEIREKYYQAHSLVIVYEYLRQCVTNRFALLMEMDVLHCKKKKIIVGAGAVI